jgi:hypothetical protein
VTDPTFPFPKPASRLSRGLLKIKGEIVTGWTHPEVENSDFASADMLLVKIAANAPAVNSLANAHLLVPA